MFVHRMSCTVYRWSDVAYEGLAVKGEQPRACNLLESQHSKQCAIMVVYR